jgi:hypothetical protein
MKKFVTFLIEIIMAPLLMGAILIKYPGSIDWLIEWASFAILWHLTWQIASSFDGFRNYIASGLRKHRLTTVLIGLIAVILISIGYRFSIKLGMRELGKYSLASEPVKTVQLKPSVRELAPPTPRSNSVFDSTIAEWRIKNSPFDLTLHDLFLTDFNRIEQKAMGAIFVDPDRKISVQYAILISLSTRSKFLSFYVLQSNETAKICASLANDYGFVLDKATQLLLTENEPGSSGTVSTKEAVFTRRIYIYHETYLDAGTTAKLVEFYSHKGLSVILRSIDYLYTKKLEYRIQKDNVIQK